MRKFIIDTGTGSDDAVALMMAVLCREVEILGVTTVCGNVPRPLATQNALMTLEVCNSGAKVYEGADRPMLRQAVTAVAVHGDDGMGDLDLIHPSRRAEKKNAVDFILEQVRRAPGEIEIVTLGPAVNIAAAVMSDRAAMSGVKHIYSMGTQGLGAGNTTPVAEFNVYADADSYRIMLESGIPLTIIGGDMCCGRASSAEWTEADMEAIGASGPVGRFAVDCNRGLLEYHKRAGERFVDLPDAVAMGVALWDDMTLCSKQMRCHCCTGEDRCCGQVIFYDPEHEFAIPTGLPPTSAELITKIDVPLYKSRLARLLAGGPLPEGGAR